MPEFSGATTLAAEEPVRMAPVHAGCLRRLPDRNSLNGRPPAQLHPLLKGAVGSEAERRLGRADRAAGVRGECPRRHPLPIGVSRNRGSDFRDKHFGP